MNQMEKDNKDETGTVSPSCGVNMSFNFSVGAIAIIAGLMIAILLYINWP